VADEEWGEHSKRKGTAMDEPRLVKAVKRKNDEGEKTEVKTTIKRGRGYRHLRKKNKKG